MSLLNAPEEKEEVCENFRQSRNHGKIDLGKQEQRALMENKHSETEREHVASTSRLVHATKKGLRDATPSSPDPKNAPEEKEEVCENFRQSRNHGKIDLGKQEQRALMENKHSETEREHVASTSRLVHATKKGLRDATPSSPDPKNAPEEKEEVCENFRQSRNHGKIDLGKQEQRALMENKHSETEREHVASTSRLVHATKKGLRDATPSSPDPKNAPEEKEEVCENFRQSRNHGKIDLGKQEQRALMENKHSETEREHVASTSRLVHATKKGLRDATPSSPDPKNAPEEKEEVCENFRQSRNHGKIDLGKQEQRALMENKHSETEREHVASTSRLVHATKKGLRDATPSSPDPKNAPEEKEEVCENFRQSRNHGKIDLGKQEQRALMENKHSETEREHVASTSRLVHATKKGLRDATPSSPDPKNAPEEKEEVCENFRQSRNHGKIDLGKQEQRALMENKHSETEREHVASTSRLVHATKKGLRDATPSSPDPKNAPEEKEEVCENFRQSRNHGKIDLGKQEQRALMENKHSETEREHVASTSRLVHATKKGLLDATPSSPDPKNAPEEKEEVCENFRQSRNHGKIDLGKQEQRALMENKHSETEREHVASTSRLVHATKKGLRDATPSSPDPKNAPEEKEEVCENFRQSRNHGKIDLGKQEQRALMENKHSETEREHVASTSRLVHATKKGLRDATPSSPDPKNAPEEKEEVCENFRQSRNHGKIDLGKQEQRALMENKHSETEREHVASTSRLVHATKKGLRDATPSSPDPKNAPEEKEEVCENFRQSRNHGKIDLGKQEQRALMENKHSETEREHVASTSRLVHATKKGLRDATPSSPDPKVSH
ncbi:uncharacterized protein LOC110597437, partial [Ictidomys tridecemlineatus]